MMFPDRAPSDLYLYTTFIGGSRNQELAKASRLPLSLYFPRPCSIFAYVVVMHISIMLFFFCYFFCCNCLQGFTCLIVVEMNWSRSWLLILDNYWVRKGSQHSLSMCYKSMVLIFSIIFSEALSFGLVILWICCQSIFRGFYSSFCSHLYWSKAFPLYGHDYNSAIEAIDKMEKNLPGFFYAGNYYSHHRESSFFISSSYWDSWIML